MNVEDTSDDEDCGSYASDDDDEFRAFHLLNKHLVPKLSSRRRHKSEANWIPHGGFYGMAEVVKFKGNLLKSTGIVRDSRVCLHIEEIGYLMQREALTVFNGGSPMTIMDVYLHIMVGDCGCTWEAFKVFVELKTLGYIVGRHNISWSKAAAVNTTRPISEELCGRLDRLQIGNNSCDLQGNLYIGTHPKGLSDSTRTPPCGVHMNSDIDMHTCHQYGESGGDVGNVFMARDAELMFDVFPPNSNFKKTSPGTPDFSLCISSQFPPDRAFMESLRANNENIPVKIATIESGRVSFFQFDEIMEEMSTQTKEGSILLVLMKAMSSQILLTIMGQRCQAKYTEGNWYYKKAPNTLCRETKNVLTF